ncbi:MAG: hypothetical protein LBI70_03835 [Rickettsiales bacterium]|jgi:hypothetical protein|nr:hypothetical protein [Rickettsiales bacterium]
MMRALVMNSGKLEKIKVTLSGEGDSLTATAIVKREGLEDCFECSFSLGEARQAGLLSKDIWHQYPRRMLEHRALSFALRDGFSDILNGFSSTEEIEEMEDHAELTQESFRGKEITVTGVTNSILPKEFETIVGGQEDNEEDGEYREELDF